MRQIGIRDLHTALARPRLLTRATVGYRPANPYDNAGCEGFLKTLKREELYANRYEDLEHLRKNIHEFIEEYYNRQRLHSALGYRPPAPEAILHCRRVPLHPPDFLDLTYNT
jgi:hypothetical protein